MKILIASLIGYVIGSIPFALVIGKLFYNIDVREHGSGNLGGTNAGRTLGAKAGIAVGVLDIFKAFIAMVIVRIFLPDHFIYAGFMATIGHCYPLFANFKGGKAVSTAAGFLIAIATMITKKPLIHILIPFISVILILYITKMVSLSTMSALVIASITLLITKEDPSISITFIIITIIVIYRHKSNIKRIINKEESKITWM